MASIKRLKYCINNEWLESATAKYMPVMNPSLGVQIAEAPCCTQGEVDAAVKAAAVRRARETWYLVDDSKFGRVYPAVIGEIYSGAILTNRCPDPKYRQLTLVKETEQ